MSVRVGLVGVGMMGGVHYGALRKMAGVEVVALCDIDPSRLEKDSPTVQGNLKESESQQSFDAARKYTDLAELLKNPDVDAVDICTPTDLHAAMAEQALRAGKHAFCEKPMARTGEQAKALAAVARETGQFLMIGHVLRFWGEYHVMKAIRDEGRYGPLRMAKFWRSGGAPAWDRKSWFADTARSGCAALDLHIHDTDTIQWFFGVPRAVTSFGTIRPDGGVDYLWTRFHGADDAVIVAEGGWTTPGSPFAMGATLMFESATVDYHSGREKTLAIYVPGEKPLHPEIPDTGAYAGELRYFMDCVRDGQAPEHATPDQAAASIAIVEAEIEAVKSGRTVAVQV